MAKEGSKSIVRREWLSTLKFVIVQNPVGESENNVIEKEAEQLNAETRHL